MPVGSKRPARQLILVFKGNGAEGIGRQSNDGGSWLNAEWVSTYGGKVSTVPAVPQDCGGEAAVQAAKSMSLYDPMCDGPC